MTPELFDISTTFWILAITAGLLVGLGKGGLAGLGIIAIPIMAMIFPAGYSVGIIAPLLLIGDFFGVIFYRRHAVWKEILRALPIAFVGIAIGYLFMQEVDLSDNELKIFIGAMVLFILIFGIWQEWRNKRLGVKSNASWWVIIFMGVLGGFSTITANAAGPLFSIYLLYLGMEKKEFVGTRAWLFFVINITKIPLLWNLGSISVDSLYFNLKIIPFIFLGFLGGRYLIGIIPQNKFNFLVRLLAGAAAAKLLLF